MANVKENVVFCNDGIFCPTGISSEPELFAPFQLPALNGWLNAGLIFYGLM